MAASLPSPASILPHPPRPVPEELREAYGAFQKLQAERRFAEATTTYPKFLQKLQRAWGEVNPDLAPYVYDFALALRLERRPPHESAAIAGKALEK